MALFTSETGRKALCRRAGLASARYWRARGFENLARGRTVIGQLRWQARIRAMMRELEAAGYIVTPPQRPG